MLRSAIRVLNTLGSVLSRIAIRLRLTVRVIVIVSLVTLENALLIRPVLKLLVVLQRKFNLAVVISGRQTLEREHLRLSNLG